MLLGLFAAIAFAPAYWLVVPRRWRREGLAAASLAALTLYDARLLALLVGVTAGLFAVTRAIQASEECRGQGMCALALCLLAALFVFNKLGGAGASALPSQTGLVFLGVSYLVLKAAAVLVETARGTIREVRFLDMLGWLVFLPTYPSGPMEELDHFRRQSPTFDPGMALRGFERIVFGLVKALIAAHYLGEWANSVFSAPAQHAQGTLLLALYAFALRFYLDFSGYSDIAIGLAALYGYEIEENFDYPFFRRNLVQLWQRWHMTLTRFLRLYLFIPVSRRLMRRGWRDGLAIAAGQIVAMTFCGLWHGLSWNFVVWGLLQALGLIWVGLIARDIGRTLPPGAVRWWRRSRVAYGFSTAVTVTYFALSAVFVVTDVGSAARYLRLLVGA